jgi:hypothetical protein
MPSAAHLPVFCQACQQLHLEPVQPGQTPSCRDCGKPASILPGPTYIESDVALFERVASAVNSATLPRRTCEQIVAELRDATLRTAPELVLLRVVDFLPGLHFLLPALYLQPTRQLDRVMMTRAGGMVQAIVSARLRELEGPRAQPAR